MDMDKLLASLTLAAFAQMIFIALILLWSGQDQDHISRNVVKSDQDMCVPCDQVQLGEDKPNDLADTISKQKIPRSDQIECCGQPSIILRGIVLKKLQEKKDRLIQGIDKEGCNQVPAAQMNGITATSSAEKNMIHWKTSAPSFFKGGVRYKDGRIIVPSAGHYFVYFQLKHRQNHCQPATMEFSNKAPYVDEIKLDNIQTDYLYRYSPKDGHTRIALKTSKLNCKSDFAEDRSTSYVGAVFYLNDHDELFVNTSCQENQEKSTEGNYFGLFISYEVP